MYDPCPNYYSKQFGVLRALADADPPSPYPRARLFTHTRIYYLLFEAGSDADELTRRRRPVKDKDHGHEPPKHDEPDWCTPMLSCYKDSDCLDKLPCQKTYCKLSHRGKQGQKEGNCVCKGELDAEFSISLNH